MVVLLLLLLLHDWRLARRDKGWVWCAARRGPVTTCPHVGSIATQPVAKAARAERARQNAWKHSAAHSYSFHTRLLVLSLVPGLSLVLPSQEAESFLVIPLTPSLSLSVFFLFLFSSAPSLSLSFSLACSHPFLSLCLSSSPFQMDTFQTLSQLEGARKKSTQRKVKIEK